MFSTIDTVICLSLKHRQDRRDSLLSNYPKYLPQIEWFDAYTPATCFVPPSWRHIESYYATTYGHLKILEKLHLDNNWSNCLILEDDAKFLPVCFEDKAINNLLSRIENSRPDWLSIFLGYHLQQNMTEVDEVFSLNNGCTQSHAYIVNPCGVRRMYDHLWVKNFDIVDWAYCDLMDKDKAFFSPNQKYVTTSEGFSENAKHWKSEGS